MANFKPNEISDAREKEVVSKFQKHSKGVVIGNPFVSPGHTNWDDHSAKWADLTNSRSYRPEDIKAKMEFILDKIVKSEIEDDILGDRKIAFSFTTTRGVVVKVSWEEMYIFLRSALKERIASAEYKADTKKAADLKAFIESHKSVDTKLAEAQKEYDEINKRLLGDSSVPAPAPSPANANATA